MDIESRLKTLIAEAFSLVPNTVDENTGMDSVAGWDSINSDWYCCWKMNSALPLNQKRLCCSRTIKQFWRLLKIDYRTGTDK